MNALTAAVADELVRTFDELLQPQRLSMPDPLMRIAFACNAFIEKAMKNPILGCSCRANSVVLSNGWPGDSPEAGFVRT